MDELKPGIYYKDEEWRLYIDSSKRSLKAVLLHNTKAYASISIAYSTKLEEVYSNMKITLEKIKCEQHKWQKCGDFKVLSTLLGQQSGNTKYPCFLRLCNTRVRGNHYKRKSLAEKNVTEKRIQKHHY